MSIEDLMDIVTRNTGYTKEQLRNNVKMLPLAYARMIFARLCTIDGYKHREIAEALNKNHCTISYYNSKFKDNFECVPKFKELADVCLEDYLNIIKEE